MTVLPLGAGKIFTIGKYNIILEPLHPDRDYGMIIEFKVFQPRKGKNWKIR